MVFVSVSLFFLCFLCVSSVKVGVTCAKKLLCLLYKTVAKNYYYSLAFLRKGRVF